MKSIPRHLCTAILLSLPVASVGALAGCTNDASHEQPEATGTLSAALSTVGPDGATYKFVTGSQLVISAPTWGAAFPIDDAATMFQRRLGVGSYTLDIGFGQYGAMPVLEKTLNDHTELVFPEWTDSHPIAFTIVDGQVTSVVLHFNVKGLGNITFATGQLEVTADVTKETVNQASRLEQTASLTVDSVTFADPNAAYVAPLDLSVGGAYGQMLVLAPTGAWALEYGDAVCVPVTVSTTGSSGTGSEGLGRRLAQLLTAPGKACIHDGGAVDTLKIVLSTSGPAPLAQQSFLPDPDYFRNVIISGSIPDVFDGGAFQQSALEAWLPLTTATFQHRLYATAPSFTELTSVVGQLDGYVKLRAD